MSLFKFNGDWEMNIEISSFAQFQNSTSKLKLIIEDDLTDNPDPYPEQFSL